MNLAQLAVAQRLTLVSGIGTPADGESLSGQNVNAFPEGALFYAVAQNRFYRLKKGLPVTVTPGGQNVVSGCGSNAGNGAYFVACQQQGTVTLGSGGTITQVGLDLTTAGFFVITLITPGGTTGFVHGAITNDHTATFTSAQSADTGTYGFVFVETGTEA